MSHNSTKVDAQEANRQGELSSELNDLSDVSASSPADQAKLTWSGSAWQNDSSGIIPLAAVGSGTIVALSESSTAQSYPNPNLSGTDPNRMFWEYASLLQGGTGRMRTVTSGGVSFRYNSYGGGSTRWVVGFDFADAGVYSLRATLHLGGLSSTGAYIDCGWTDISYNALGPRIRFGKSDVKRNTLRGIIDASAGATAGLYVYDESGARYSRASYDNILIEVERIA